MARLPLYDPRPPRAPVDRSHRETVMFRSAVDGRSCQVDVYRPGQPTSDPFPLVIAPHPIGWTPREEYWGGIKGLRRGHSRGWRGLAHRIGFVLAVPHGHERVVPLNSLGHHAQIADLRQIVEAVDRLAGPLDRSRVYAAGTSMGAQEALLFAGSNPDVIAGVVAFNPVVDLAAWYDDLEASTDPDIRSYRTWERIRDEVGGTPSERPEAYQARSPLSVVAGLATVPTLVIWSRHDGVVPRQATHHAVALRDAVTSIRESAPFALYEHTTIHGLATVEREDGWRLHEWCDYELAVRWLLAHRRPLAA